MGGSNKGVQVPYDSVRNRGADQLRQRRHYLMWEKKKPSIMAGRAMVH